MSHLTLDQRVSRLERIFNGNIVEYERREAAAELQRKRDAERRAPGPNHEANLAKMAKDAERQPYLAKKQS